MNKYDSAARVLAIAAGATYSVESIPTPRRKNPVRHYRVTIDARYSSEVAITALGILTGASYAGAQA